MYRDLINIIDDNIKYLKNCLGLTEAHITWGNRSIKMKYTKIKERLLMKMREERVYRKEYLKLEEYERICKEPQVSQPEPYVLQPTQSSFNIISTLYGM